MIIPEDRDRGIPPEDDRHHRRHIARKRPGGRDELRPVSKSGEVHQVPQKIEIGEPVQKTGHLYGQAVGASDEDGEGGGGEAPDQADLQRQLQPRLQRRGGRDRPGQGPHQEIKMADGPRLGIPRCQ